MVNNRGCPLKFLVLVVELGGKFESFKPQTLGVWPLGFIIRGPWWWCAHVSCTISSSSHFDLFSGKSHASDFSDELIIARLWCVLRTIILQSAGHVAQRGDPFELDNECQWPVLVQLSPTCQCLTLAHRNHINAASLCIMNWNVGTRPNFIFHCQAN